MSETKGQMTETPRPGTPLPWYIGAGIRTNIFSEGGLRVARTDFDGDLDSPEAHTNGIYIVHACNALPDLEAELALWRKKAEAWKEWHRLERISKHATMDIPELVQKMKDALAILRSLGELT